MRKTFPLHERYVDALVTPHLIAQPHFSHYYLWIIVGDIAAIFVGDYFRRQVANDSRWNGVGL